MTDNYRDTFYSNYYQNQQNRRSEDGKESARIQEEKFRNQILSHLPADRSVRILDAGCGTGQLLQYLDKQGYRNIEGIDISSEQVEVAHRRGVENVEQADIFEYLQRSDRTWDVILAIDLIEHFSKEEAHQLLKSIYQHLHEKGIFIARTPNVDAPFGTVYAYGDITHGMILNRSSAEQLMQTSGFEFVDVESDTPVSHGGLKGIMQHLVWKAVRIGAKAIFFASGRSMKQVELGSNLLIMAGKKSGSDGG